MAATSYLEGESDSQSANSYPAMHANDSPEQSNALAATCTCSRQFALSAKYAGQKYSRCHVAEAHQRDHQIGFISISELFSFGQG